MLPGAFSDSLRLIAPLISLLLRAGQWRTRLSLKVFESSVLAMILVLPPQVSQGSQCSRSIRRIGKITTQSIRCQLIRRPDDCALNH
jgi:hypothetical protein